MTMWARWLESLIAAWLIASAWLFSLVGVTERLVVPLAAGVVLLLIEFAARWRHALHLLVLPVALALIAWGWARFPRPGPAAAQNAILAGLVLGLLAIVPSAAGEPPSAWRPHVRTEETGESVST